MCHGCPSLQAVSFFCWIIIRASQLFSLSLIQLTPYIQNFIQKYPFVDVVPLFITFQWCYTEDKVQPHLHGLQDLQGLAPGYLSSFLSLSPWTTLSLFPNFILWHFLAFIPNVPASSSCSLIFAACGNTQLHCDHLLGWLPRVGYSIFCLRGI